ncbi:MAG TPA: DUF5665 domain-containing protein [Candidatus Saccharimonadales bacterium]|nr:DUF5665 domain-containing protein [Candidatus Saccharimonadales bacterium]
MTPTKKKPETNRDYEQIGRMVANIYESGYIDKGQTYKMSFVKGLLAGLGGVLGATIVVALLLWFLSFFNEVPLIGPVVNSVRHSIESKDH